MREKWGFLDSGHLDAAINMALDEMLINWHQEGAIPTTVRFYGWKVPSLSVGYFQNLKAINFKALQQYGCQFVKRITGGSAVLHDDELTYSIIISEKHPQIPKSIQQAYQILSKGILHGYNNINIYPEYATPEMSQMNSRTAVCFEEPSYYELVVNNKKISGNAQTRKKGILLQHGSIPMSINEQMLFDLFTYPSEKIRRKNRLSFKNKATTINELTKKKFTYKELKDAFFKGFETGLNITLEPYQLTTMQWEEVHNLAKTKYEYDFTEDLTSFSS